MTAPIATPLKLQQRSVVLIKSMFKNMRIKGRHSIQKQEDVGKTKHKTDKLASYCTTWLDI